MKTKILLIGLTIFLVNVISANARETIKTCYYNKVVDGFNYLVFPKDDSKPYGWMVAAYLITANKLNLELKIIERKNFGGCLDLMRNGEIDFLLGLSVKEERKEYIDFFEYIGGNGKTKNGGISKKSKFISKINNIKNSFPTKKEWDAIFETNWTSAYQHDWDDNKVKYESLLPGALLVSYKRVGSAKEKGFLSFHGCKTKSPVEWSSGSDYSFYLTADYDDKFNMIFCLSEGKIKGFFKSNKIEGIFDPPFDMGAIGNKRGSVLKQFNLKVKTSKGNGKMEIRDAMGERNAKWDQIRGEIFVKGKKVESFGVANADGYNKNDDHYTPKKNLLVTLIRHKDNVGSKEGMLALQKKKEKEKAELPKNELGLFYQTYAYLKKCHEVRKGYKLVHVNSVEMANYKSKAKSIENGIFKKYPDIKPMKDEIWKKSTRTVSANEIYQATLTGKFLWGVAEITTNLSDWQEVCNDYKTMYNKLIKMYGGGGTTEKDF